MRWGSNTESGRSWRRRGWDFTWAATVMVAAAFVCGTPALSAEGLTSSRGAMDSAWQRLDFTRPQMGVPFRILVHTRDEAAAQRAVEAAYERVARLNAILSDYDPDSEVSRFCHETPVGVAVVVSPELWFMLERSQHLARASGGAFDVTVGPAVNLWRRTRRHRVLPSETLLREALAPVGWRYLEMRSRDRSVAMRVPGMRLDFGGIGKGYAAGEAVRVLREHGFPHALVAASGDIVVGAAPPGSRGWRLEFGTDGREGSPPPRHAYLENAALSTSGDLYQYVVIDGRRYSHIVDPRTGLGMIEQSLVSVIARDGTTADGLDTAASVLGPERGLKLVDATRGAAILMIQPTTSGGHREWMNGRMERLLRRASGP